MRRFRWNIACFALFSAVAVMTARVDAQQTAIVHYPGGGPTRDGYSSASIPVRYSFLSCDGELWITMGAVPSNISLSTTYWYKGKQYPVPAVKDDWSSHHARLAGDVLARTAQGVRKVTTVDYNTGPAYSGGCFSAINFESLAPMKTLMGDQRTDAQVSSFLSSLYVSPNSEFQPLTSYSVESALSAGIARAAADEARAVRERAEVARMDSISKAKVAARAADSARAEQARKAAQASTTAAGASNGSSSGTSSTASNTGAGNSGASRADTRVSEGELRAAREAASAREKEAANEAKRAADQRAAEAREAKARQDKEEREKAASELGSAASGIVASAISDGHRVGMYYVLNSPTGPTAKDFTSVGIVLETGKLSYLQLGLSTAFIGKLLDSSDTTVTDDPMSYSFGIIHGFDLLGVDEEVGIFPLVELGMVLGSKSDLEAKETFSDMLIAGFGLGMRIGGVDALVTYSPFMRTKTLNFGLAMKF